MTRPTLARTVAILCGATEFQRFLAERAPDIWSKTGDFSDTHRAAEVVRRVCRINSRSALDTDPAAARRYHAQIGLAFSTWRSARDTKTSTAAH